MRLPPAAEALARLQAVSPAIGVTRLAVLTGLDVIGIPVAAAIRPNSRTLAAHQGKGPSLEAAKVSALMEALECFCAETLDVPLRLAAAAELPGALDVSRLPRRRGGPDPATQRLLWAEGRSLFSGRTCWVPRELVAADFTRPQPPGNGVFQATTNGLGAGFAQSRALLHGLCEAIERDAMALWHGAPDAVQAAALIDPDSVDGAQSRFYLRLCAAAGVEAAIWEVTSDTGVPVFAAMLADPAGRVQPELGAACRPDPDAALAAALAEAAQARATTISGARDDLTAEAFEPRAVQARAAAAARWRGVPAARPFRGGGACPDDPLAFVLRCLDRAGFGEAACVRLPAPDPGLFVVRVVVPGLEGPWGEPGGEYAPGARAAAAR